MEEKTGDEGLTAECQIGCLRRIRYLTGSYYKDKKEASELLKFWHRYINMCIYMFKISQRAPWIFSI